MTAQELEQKYIGRMTDEDKLNDQFHMMGKFGKASMYTFSFNTYGYTISADICIECGKITGIVPEKEEREDEWGYVPEDASPDIQPEEYDTIARYLESVVA